MKLIFNNKINFLHTLNKYISINIYKLNYRNDKAFHVSQ